jgi:16S rRNA (adenine1518-N6/adenine1519-N6)-dimethyltransferase
VNEAKKSLGQHWLYDGKSLSAIVSMAGVSDSDTVLEVGPGLGTLTEVLCRSAKQVIAVELDHELAENLRNLPNDNLLIVEEDIRKYDLRSLPNGYKLVANIPYYLTSFLLRLLFESENPPEMIVMLVQKEVAERIASSPGNMSVLAISAQIFGTIELGRVVEAELFKPPPKVDSQIVKITKHQSDTQTIDKRKFYRIVKAGFSSRRKKLSNNLSSGLNIDKKVVEAQIINLELSENVRAQELSLENWFEIYNNLRAYL